MGERKVGKSEAIIEATGNLVSKVRDPWSLAALAIAGIVFLFYGARTDDTLGSVCLALGLSAIVGIVWLLIKPSPSRTGSDPSVIDVDQTPDWTQGGRDEHGFFIEEERLEVRYLDWGEKHHREIYDKYVNVVPIRNCDLKIDALAGSSSPKNMEFYHTHVYKKVREDHYHTRLRVTIAGATKGTPIKLLGKSIRYDIPNESEGTHTEVTAHPRLDALGVAGKDKQFVVIHVLYPTEKLSFIAHLLGEHRAQLGTVEAHQFTQTNYWKVEPPEIMGVEDGDLQVLVWTKKEVKGETDFVISWKWRAL